MKPRLSERARRLVDALNVLWSSRRSGGGLESLLSADETETHRAAPTTETSAAAARAETPPPADAQRGADGPLAGCTTCEPAGPTADELEVNAVGWWLIDNLPECWYSATPAQTREMAAALVTLRRGVEAGRWQP